MNAQFVRWLKIRLKQTINIQNYTVWFCSNSCVKAPLFQVVQVHWRTLNLTVYIATGRKSCFFGPLTCHWQAIPIECSVCHRPPFTTESESVGWTVYEKKKWQSSTLLTECDTQLTEKYSTHSWPRNREINNWPRQPKWPLQSNARDGSELIHINLK